MRRSKGKGGGLTREEEGCFGGCCSSHRRPSSMIRPPQPTPGWRKGKVGIALR